MNALPKGFEILLDRYDPKKIVANVPLSTIWQTVVDPLIARRHGLIQKNPSEKVQETSSPIASAPAGQTDIKSQASDPSPVIPTSTASPVSTSSAEKNDANPPTGMIPRPSSPVGPHASAIPAASRINRPSQTSQEGDPSNPKGDAASDTKNPDADDDGTVVGEDDIFESNPISSATAMHRASSCPLDDSSPQATVDEPSEPEASNPIHVADDATKDHPPKKSEPSQPLPAEIAKPFASRTSSSTFPAVTDSSRIVHPPRPRVNTQTHTTGDGSIEVGPASVLDPDLRAALQEESASNPVSTPIPSTRLRRNTAQPYVPDADFKQAGGASRSDPPPPTSETSMSSIGSRSALCGLLRSEEFHLKLKGVDPLNCQTNHVIMTALQEIDPKKHHNAQKQYKDMHRSDLIILLCNEVGVQRSPEASNRLRRLLIEMEVAENTKSSPTSAPRRAPQPPPLPLTKSAVTTDASNQPHGRFPPAKG